MTKYLKRMILLCGLTMSLLAPAAPALAYNPFSSACGAQGGAAKSSSACSVTGSDPVTGSNGILAKVSTIIALIAGIAAVIVIIISGFQFITSGGDPQAAASARKALIGALVGLVIIAAAQTILVFVLSKV